MLSGTESYMLCVETCNNIGGLNGKTDHHTAMLYQKNFPNVCYFWNSQQHAWPPKNDWRHIPVHTRLPLSNGNLWGTVGRSSSWFLSRQPRMVCMNPVQYSYFVHSCSVYVITTENIAFLLLLRRCLCQKVGGTVAIIFMYYRFELNLGQSFMYLNSYVGRILNP